MAINSKNKGSTYERKISNLLSQRFADYLGKTQGFFRNSSSGSYFGATNQKRLDTHLEENAVFGDIVVPQSFLYTIECKHYKTPPAITALIRGEYRLFDTWIEQSSQDANNAGKRNLIIVKFNNVPDFVLVSRDDYQDIDRDAFAYYKDYALVELTKWLGRDDFVFFA